MLAFNKELLFNAMYWSAFLQEEDLEELKMGQLLWKIANTVCLLLCQEAGWLDGEWSG